MRRTSNMLGPAAALALAAALTLTTSAAHATLRPQVKVRFASEPVAAQAGALYQGGFEIIAIHGGRVTDLHLEGEGWSGFDLSPDDSVTLTPDQIYPVQFQAIPGDPSQPLFVVFLYDGQQVRRKFDLSPQAIAEIGKPRPTVKLPGSGAPTGAALPAADAIKPDPSAVQPMVRPSRAGAEPRTEEVGPTPSVNGHWVTVFGRFVYQDSFGNWVGAHGMTVRLYDQEDLAPDDYLGAVATTPDGFWSATVWADEDYPDIYMEFYAANTVVEIEHDNITQDTYYWVSGVHENFGGSSLNHGVSASASWSLHPVLYILSNITRTWLWLNAMGFASTTPAVDVDYPVDSPLAYYDGEVNIDVDSRWDVATHVHEYGHHWVKYNAKEQDTNYCNQTCDRDYPDDCGHCGWCEESYTDAWNEGFPYWLADAASRHIAAHYGAMLSGVESYETLQQCVSGDFFGNMPCACTPAKTELFVSSLLRDIEDATGGTDAQALSGGQDALGLGPDEILWVTRTHDPGLVSTFLYELETAFPNIREALWMTQRNNRFPGSDNLAPGVVANLVAIGHQVGLVDSSTDGTIHFEWDRAPDDCSGTAGYGISITQAPAMPAQTMGIGNVTSYTTYDLGPGAYYFNIRAKDRSGKWSSGYVSLGPFAIREPHPADLALQERDGWEHPVIPRKDDTATLGSVPTPTSLPGDALDTWYNWNLANVGELMNTTPNFKVQLRLDGAPVETYNAYQFLQPGEEFAQVNQGPVLVRGGRHTFEVFAESGETWPEVLESNNRWARQWAWTPVGMNALAPPMVRLAPPDRTGGWSWIKDDNPFDPNDGPWENCDGLRIPDLRALEGDRWRAIAIHAQDNADDYNADLHYVTTFGYVNNAFTQASKRSQRPAGGLDAVLVNDFKLTTGAWDVGIVNQSGGASQYVADYERSSVIAVPDSIAVSMGQDEMIRMFHFWLPPLTGGPTTITVASDSIAGLHVLWFDATTYYANLVEADAQAVSGADGTAKLVFYAGGDPQPHGIVVFRDPSDGAGPIGFGLKIRSSLHDYVCGDPPSGWDALLVPRPDDAATPGSAPRPGWLTGDAAATYLNLAFQNHSPIPGADVTAGVCVDDSCIAQFTYPGPAAGEYVIANEPVPVAVPGGRHTIALRIDPENRLEETDENDNGYAEQYVWTPGTLMGFTAPVTRPLPGNPVAGWGLLPPSDEPLWINVDGVRSAPFGTLRPIGSWWGGIAVAPQAGFDADLSLFELSTGAKDGFDSTLAWSGWGAGLTEFVLVNFQATPARTFDVGVESCGALDGTAGPGTYIVQSVTSTFLGSDPEGSFGPYEMFPDHILQLYTMNLSPGGYRIHLESLAGAVDWGISLYAPGQAFASKLGHVPLAASWDAGAGMSEEFQVNLDRAGPYCLAVWKRGAADVPNEGGYRVDLAILTASAGGDERPVRTALAGVYPNPLRSTTTVAFDLARDGDASIEVFDVAGARVRTLAAGAHTAGRHSVRWDGADSHGRRVAEGVYVVRLRAGGVAAGRKVIVMDR